MGGWGRAEAQPGTATRVTPHPPPPERQRRGRRQRGEEGLADVDVWDSCCGCGVPHEDAVRIQHRSLVLPIRLHTTQDGTGHTGECSRRPQLSNACPKQMPRSCHARAHLIEAPLLREAQRPLAQQLWASNGDEGAEALDSCNHERLVRREVRPEGGHLGWGHRALIDADRTVHRSRNCN